MSDEPNVATRWTAEIAKKAVALEPDHQRCAKGRPATGNR